MKKILTHIFLVYFLFMTTYAFVFTMTKVQWFPFISWKVLRYHYGMMAPYQGFSTMNMDLLAEGERADGTWEEIDMSPYYPMHRGSAIMYRRLRSFFPEGEEVHGEKYRELALLLKEREMERGREYASVRLTWVEWPASPEGFDALKTSDHWKAYPIVTVP